MVEKDYFKDDVKYIGTVKFIPWEKLRGKTLFITGGTGIIGYSLLAGLLRGDEEHKLGLKILVLTRSLEQAKKRFAEVAGREKLHFLEGDVVNFPPVEEKIDYIIHGASQTSSLGFIQKPVETITTAVTGTRNVLELARKNSVQGFAYLSTMEVYGYPEKGHKVTEEEMGALSSLEVRNSYPLSKQLCESMTCGYASEYNLPASIVRLTQTFGPGADYQDGRVFAYFGRCAAEGKDIVLKTKGETERCYLYTADAATAILQVLLAGKAGHAYNAASEDTYCSIAEMAEKIAQEYDIKVRFDLQDTSKLGFAAPLCMNLSTEALQKLSWQVRPETCGLGAMYKRMIGHWQRMKR